MMPTRRPVRLALTSILAAATLAACSSSGTSASQQTGGKGSSTAPAAATGTADIPAVAAASLKGKKVAYLTLTQSCQYCATQENAFKAAMKAAGAQVTMSTTNFNAAEQAQQINQAISTRPDLIVVWPTDTTSIIPGLTRIKQARIPVVVTTYPPATKNDSLWNAWVGPSDYQLGVQSATSLVEGLKAAKKPLTGSVVEVTGTPGASSTIARGQGFEDTIRKLAPDLKLIGKQPGNWDQTQATTAAATLFSQYGNDHIVGIYGEADNMLAGALVAAQRAGYQPGKNLIAVGSDCTIEGYNNIKAGKEFGTNLQDPTVDGKTIARVAGNVLLGKSVQKTTYIATPRITASNVEQCASAVGK